MDNFIPQIKAELKRLKQERSSIEQRIRALENTLFAYSLKDTAPKKEMTHHKSKRQNRADKIAEILDRAGAPLHYKEILDQLEKMEGGKLKAKDPESTITATLSAYNDRFIRVNKGIYDLSSRKSKE